MEILKFVNASRFLPEYCGIPYSSWTKRKMSGKDNTGKPLDWTDEDRVKIQAGLKRLAKDGKKLTKKTAVKLVK